MLEHRKRDLTPTGGLEAMPVGHFSGLLDVVKNADRCNSIACASFPSQETGKMISVARS